MENKTVAIIQARLTSTRFPQKILQKIPELKVQETEDKTIPALIGGLAPILSAVAFASALDID